MAFLYSIRVSTKTDPPNLNDFFLSMIIFVDGECHVSNITVVTDTTEDENNVTSISIEHDSNSFHNQEHDNEVMLVTPLIHILTPLSRP